MSQPIIPRDLAAEQLAVPVRILVRYETRGLIRADRQGEVEGYAPAELRRLSSIISYQRDLGINLAGVEAVLKLRRHLADVHRQLAALAVRLNDACDESTDQNIDA